VLENIEALEYQALQQEKRDKLNARLQIWSLLLALVSGFGIASLQSGIVGYVVALYPLLAFCVARYAAHSEAVLDQVKAYLLALEQDLNHQGYEHFNKQHKLMQSVSGGHKKALRDAIVLTDVLAVVAVLVRLQVAGWWVLGVLVALENVVVVLGTWRCLSENVWSLKKVEAIFRWMRARILVREGK
jgi:hypothetical protein